MSGLKDITLFLEDAAKELYANPMDSTASTRNADDSVDDQIDSFLIKFENESLISKEDQVMESLRNLSLNILMEQPGPEEEAEDTEGEAVAVDAEEEVATGDLEIDEPVGSERQKSEEPGELPRLPLDIDSFSQRVARLVKNGPTLLDLETVIVNRALNYLKEHYNEQHAKAMLEILDEQFDFNIDDPGAPKEVPFAVGAYAGGTGGLGGGGGV
jgi:hypothetical protein